MLNCEKPFFEISNLSKRNPYGQDLENNLIVYFCCQIHYNVRFNFMYIILYIGLYGNYVEFLVFFLEIPFEMLSKGSLSPLCISTCNLQYIHVLRYTNRFSYERYSNISKQIYNIIYYISNLIIYGENIVLFQFIKHLGACSLMYAWDKGVVVEWQGYCKCGNYVIIIKRKVLFQEIYSNRGSFFSLETTSLFNRR